jgi:hypothetical protein
MADEELKSLLKRNLEVAEDTNHVVRSMNRRAFWGGVLKFVWWVVILFVLPAIAYYVYLLPRWDQIMSTFRDFQGGAQQMNQIKANISGSNPVNDILNYFNHSSSTIGK